MMKQMTLSEAIIKLYGRKLEPCRAPIAQWQLFTPFLNKTTNALVYARLLKVPIQMYTSDEIFNKKSETYKDILHWVKPIFVERSIENSYYLLLADENLFSLDSLLKIKKESDEIMEKEMIYGYLQFVSRLSTHPIKRQISLDEKQIGVSPQGRFYLTNYMMYFELLDTDQKIMTEKKNNMELQKQMKNILVKMLAVTKGLTPNQNIFSFISEKYDQKLSKSVYLYLQSSDHCGILSQIITGIEEDYNKCQTATISDQVSHNNLDSLMSDTLNMHLLERTQQHFTENYKFGRIRKIGVFIGIFLIFLLAIGYLTFKYLSPLPLECQENQYYDQPELKCLDCDATCQRCQGSGLQMCSSCRGNQFLIMHGYNDKTGRCSEVCHGTIVRTKICIDNH